MTTSHTPGPWAIHSYVTGPRPWAEVQIVYGMNSYGDGPAGEVARCRMDSPEAGGREKDARLICAAPDLLCMLQGALFVLEKQDNTTHLCENIRAVIAKATGAA